MATVTFAVPDEIKAEMRRFSWVNWSQVARQEALKKEVLFRKLESKEEKELTEWSVKLGRKINKAAFKKLLSKLSPEEKKLLGLG